MSLKLFIQDFYLNAINEKAKTRSLLEPYVADESLLEHVDLFEMGFPKYRIEIEDMVEEGNKIVLRARFQGRHDGPFNGIPPTNKVVDLPFMIMYHIENGKIVHHWLIGDQLAMLTALGVIQMEAQSA
ncbi:ester cyclase [Flavisolibacter tropicus]|uniref:ester cyclase n=1 Tax=Flavisolibacter tropicus TaxID=1492898 RepID=UPI00082FA1F0|nr:ester cyclase [Flavisolibacter tropicus]